MNLRFRLESRSAAAPWLGAYPLPRSWQSAVAQLRRDAGMVLGRLQGHRAPPFETRRAPAGLSRGDVALLAPRTVRVARVERETPDAVTLHLVDPSGRPFTFEAGQFFTVLVPVGSEVLRRAYSASSSAREPGSVALTIKRVAGGRASSHLNEHVGEGDVLQLLGPSGSFTVAPAAEPRQLVFIAGGSGITPMMAMLRTLLPREPATRFVLLYGNRSERDIIFRAALDALVQANPSQLVLRHVLADGQPGAGVLDRQTITTELDKIGAERSAHHYVCGPEGMMVEARAALAARGTPPEHIHEERFTLPQRRGAPLAESGPQPLTIRLKGRETELQTAAGQTVLEAALAAGIRMPFSCAMGGCGACKVRRIAGRVESEEPNCLTAEEREEGLVLACVSRPCEPLTVEVP